MEKEQNWMRSNNANNHNSASSLNRGNSSSNSSNTTDKRFHLTQDFGRNISRHHTTIALADLSNDTSNDTSNDDSQTNQSLERSFSDPTHTTASTEILWQSNGGTPIVVLAKEDERDESNANNNKKAATTATTATTTTSTHAIPSRSVLGSAAAVSVSAATLSIRRSWL
mmetsp:Transcript_2151/g.3391  ORF Transcript_2151/g.3391 Transcript_2151/m.3391 type:complete len:169 (+) Transcript_2151:697-1203(+)